MIKGTRLKILVLSTFKGRNANVIRDFLFSFNAFSKHDYYYVFDCNLVLAEDIEFNRFDVILLFWSLYLLGIDLPESIRERIRKSDALKVLFLQDEYRDVRPTNEVMRSLGINLMFSCVAESDHHIFYPPSLIPSLRGTYTVLTGYVPAYLERMRRDDRTRRLLDIGYRSRAVPFVLGDLGQEKVIIAEKFQQICLEHGLMSDISVREEDRIYGRRWIKFLKSSRLSLGTGSGASVVDFTGNIRRNCELYLRYNPEAKYEHVKQHCFADVDGKVIIETISPRILESTACGTTLVLHEGRYGGILEPDVHYIPVRKDYSNISDVMARITDRSFCKQLADNAQRDLIVSGAYSYKRFVERFDNILGSHLARPVRTGVQSRVNFYFKKYCKHGECLIPMCNTYLALPHIPRVHGGTSRVRWASVRAILASPQARLLLFHYLSHKALWSIIPANHMYRDLVRLSLLHKVQAGTLSSLEPFHLSVRFQSHNGVIRFLSEKNGHYVNEWRKEIEDFKKYCVFESAIKYGRIRKVVWDHSAFGMYLTLLAKKPIPIYLASDGFYSFEALTALGNRCPHLVSQALFPLLNPEGEFD